MLGYFPPIVAIITKGTRSMFDTDTIFHKIMRKEIPCEIVHEDEHSIAIKDIAPAAPSHFLVIPKKDIPSLREASKEDSQLMGHLLLVAADLARKEGFADDGYRVVINAGERAGQTVFQLHIHLLSGRDFTWPPG